MLYYGSLQCLIVLVSAALHHPAARLAVLKATGVSSGILGILPHFFGALLGQDGLFRAEPRGGKSLFRKFANHLPCSTQESLGLMICGGRLSCLLSCATSLYRFEEVKWKERA